jgi:hypothetical protein
MFVLEFKKAIQDKQFSTQPTQTIKGQATFIFNIFQLKNREE